jgi:hypothetical protein
MIKLAIILIIAAAALSCAAFGLVAYSVVMACIACFMAGLTATIIGVLVLTNKFQMNYEVAGVRSFWSGIALMAVVIGAWTAGLNLSDGGLSANFVGNLWDVSLRCAVASFVVAAATLAGWGVLILRARRSRG